jgi:hypothetical protein
MHHDIYVDVSKAERKDIEDRHGKAGLRRETHLSHAKTLLQQENLRNVQVSG